VQVVIGRITRAHGLRGELGVEVRTDEPERRFAPGSSVVCGDRRLTVASARHHSGKLVVAFREVPDRTAAEALHGRTLEAEIDPAELPDDEDEYYDHQLVGLDVRLGDEVVGRVTGILHLPAQDTLTIAVDDREVLVPFVTELVPEVDVRAGHLTVTTAVQGLLDPDRAETVQP
jgi:16S rRNA processing protein RimM